MKRKLSDFARNVYSQFGEDGIIETTFQRLGGGEKRAIEFGAWDGFYLSNTANLWTHDWSGVLIEADADRHSSLARNTSGFDCHCIQRTVGITPGETLESILMDEGLPLRADFLSIDIDGDDYYVFKSLEKLRPRLIACEYNPTFPAHTDLLPSVGAGFGCGPLPLVRLAESMDYRLVALTESNLFFVRKEDFNLFSDVETSLEALAITKHQTHLITAYDGSWVLTQKPTYGLGRPSQAAFSGPCFQPAPATPTPGNSYFRRIASRLRGKMDRALRRSRNVAGINPNVRRAWQRDNGDLSLRLNYPLGPESTVVDLGGFRGQWASDLFAKYGCSIHVFEPVPEFASQIAQRFLRNARIKVHMVGLGKENRLGRIRIDGDASTLLHRGEAGIDVELREIGEYFKEQGIGQVALLKINIEGGEFELLEHMLDTGLVSHIDNIQVQFHTFVDDAEQRRRALQRRLAKTHTLAWDYPFVWESWRLRDPAATPPAATP